MASLTKLYALLSIFYENFGVREATGLIRFFESIMGRSRPRLICFQHFYFLQCSVYEIEIAKRDQIASALS